MRRTMKTLTVTIFLFACLSACSSAPEPTPADPTLQAALDSTMQQNADLERLTVHMVPAGGSDVCAIASTDKHRIGRPSDPEDLRVLSTGRKIVLEEGSALDVTVPICVVSGKPRAVVGVTFRDAIAKDRPQMVARAEAIAQSLEASMPK